MRSSGEPLAVEFTLDRCIKCNICLTACPVAAVTDLFPGPKYEAPQAGRFRHPFQPTPDRSVDYCSGCRVCNMVCPTGVRIAEINARARAQMVAQGKVPLIYRLRNNLLARAALVGALGGMAPFLANLILNLPPMRSLAEKTLGIARHAPFPRFTTRRFTRWYRRHHAGGLPFIDTEDDARPKVVYFHGCSTEYYESRVGIAAVRVLEANGFEVLVPPQNCCGLPLLSNGEFKAARRYHLNNVRHLVGFARRGIPIIGTSTSCTLTLKEEAPELLNMYDQETQLVASHTFDINEFLLERYAQGKMNLNLKPLPLELPYHVPCQYRAHRLGRPGTAVLSLIPGLRIIESEAACCGIAGTYGYKVEKYEIAMQVGAPLFEFIRRSQAPLAVCDSETCRWQITHATGIPTVHPVELLAAAYGYPVEEPLASLLRATTV